MESIGIKLADGSFYPILEDGKPEKKNLALTTVKDNQTTVHVDLYRSKSGSMDDAEYVDTLEITNLNPHGNGEPSLNLDIELDKDNKLNARINDPETGLESVKNVTLVSRTVEERSLPANFSIEPTEEDTKSFEDIFNDSNKESEDDNKDMSFEEILDSISNPEKETEESNPFAITKQEVENLDKIDIPEPEDTEVLGPAPNSEDFAFDDIVSSQQEEDSFDLANFVSPAEETPAKKNPEETNADTTVSEESTVAEDSSLDLPDFEEPAPADNTDSAFDIPDFEEAPATEVTSSEVTTEDAFDLPEFDSSSTDDTINADATVSDDSTVAEDRSLDLPDFEETAPADNTDSAFDIPEFEEAPATEITSSEVTSTEDAFDLPEFESSSTDDTINADATVSDDSTVVEDTSLDLPDFEETPADNTDSAFDIPDFEEAPATEITSSEVTSTEDAFDLPEFDSSDTEETVSQNNTTDSLELPNFDDLEGDSDNILDLPNFSETANASERVVEPLGIETTDDDFAPFDLPDFEDDSTETDFTMPVFDESETNTDFVLPDFEEDTKSNIAAAPITPQNMFSDLYDKETMEGKSSSAYEYNEQKKQSKAPVVICLICALICLLSLLFLFVLPTNLNLITKTQKIVQAAEQEETPNTEPETNNSEIAIQTPVPEVEETKPVKEPVPAKENEIVIATTPSQVVPEQPAKPAAKIPDIKYTVVWGDTLWDISNAYYKNPWRYTYLAEYNHLSNPNYIKTGSVILIPAE